MAPENIRPQRFPEAPAVFALRPTHFEPVAPDQVIVWEAAMRDKVGMPTAYPPEGGSWSVTGGEWGWDDCDLVAAPPRPENMQEAPSEARRTDEARRSRKPIPVAPDAPAVFMFRLTHFIQVAPDQLDEWERVVRERTGLEPPTAREGDVLMRPIGTYGWCGREDGDFDYSDSI
jgi:hypothetical protein